MATSASTGSRFLIVRPFIASAASNIEPGNLRRCTNGEAFGAFPPDVSHPAAASAVAGLAGAVVPRLPLLVYGEPTRPCLRFALIDGRRTRARGRSRIALPLSSRAAWLRE